jgi:glycerol kinase
LQVIDVILALDQGTTSSRAVLFGHDGQVAFVAQREYPQHYPRPGWVEHDPEELWAAQLDVARAAVAHASSHGLRILAIGLANQRETTLLWERATGRPLHNAIVWQDRRTADVCDALREAGHEPRVRALTGLPLDPYFSATKLAWLLDHVPGARARAERGELCFGTVDTFLLWKLTGGALHVTDPTNASRTQLLNLTSRAWDDELLELFRIPRALLPEIVPSSGELGWADAVALDIHLHLPIGGVAGDQQAAAFGQGCVRPGLAKQTYGTGAFLLAHAGPERRMSQHGLLATVDCAGYALEGAVFSAGAAVQWLRDELGIIRTAAETAVLAQAVASTGGVYCVPAFTGLGAPHWDPHARGAIFGLTRGTGREQLVRATLEAVAYQTRDVIDALQADTGIAVSELRVDGGMAANDFLLQFQADVLGVPVLWPAITETTALGAAYLAGLSVGFWQDQAELDATWALDRRFEPRMSSDERDTLYRGWQRALVCARAWSAP